MDGLGETSIGTPAVPHQKSVKVRSQNRGRLLKTSTLLNRVHGHTWTGEHPRPVQPSSYFPSSFVRTHTGFRTYPVHQHLITGFGLAGHPRHRLAQTATADRKTESLLQHPRRLAIGQS